MQNSSATPSLLRWACVAATALFVAGCPDSDIAPMDGSTTDPATTDAPATTNDLACNPGEEMTCTCPDESDSVRICEGTSFGPCQCDPAATTATSSDTESTGADTTSDDTTGDGTTSGSTDGSESSGSDSSGGEPSVCDEYIGDPANACDVWLQDCPAGDKCMPFAAFGGSWDDFMCSEVAAAPGQPGDPCTAVGAGTSGIDDCELGSMCWDIDEVTNIGTCVQQCDGCPEEPSCDDPATTCVVSNGGVLNLCLPGCDPLLQACGPGEACYPVSGTFACAPDASGALGEYGDPCEFINACDAGLACIGPAGVPDCPSAIGCCTEFCDLSDPAGDAQCMGIDQVCVGWFEAGMVPVGFEDVGVCTLVP